MSKVNDLHAQAMAQAESALMARMRGETERASELFRRALDHEISAIDALHEYSEPTYSILHRSAGTLALDCDDLRRAEQLAAQGLAKKPHPDVAQELRDLLEQVNFRRHLKLKGVELDDNELQLNLTGPAVGYGFVNCREFLTRVDDSSKLIHRIVERKRKQAIQRARTFEQGY